MMQNRKPVKELPSCYGDPAVDSNWIEFIPPPRRVKEMIRNDYITALCDLVERMNAPNPENPAGLSDLAYSRVMTGLHDDTWVRDFVPGVA